MDNRIWRQIFLHRAQSAGAPSWKREQFTNLAAFATTQLAPLIRFWQFVYWFSMGLAKETYFLDDTVVLLNFVKLSFWIALCLNFIPIRNVWANCDFDLCFWNNKKHLSKMHHSLNSLALKTKTTWKWVLNHLKDCSTSKYSSFLGDQHLPIKNVLIFGFFNVFRFIPYGSDIQQMGNFQTFQSNVAYPLQKLTAKL